MPFFFVDYWYLILVVPALLVSIWAQFKVKSTFQKYSQVGTRSGMTGRQASEAIQRENGLQVPIERTPGSMTDHYDPRGNVIRLSETVGDVASISAIGVAAHETGHALQYRDQYAPVKLRTVIYPVTNFACTISPLLILVGLVASISFLAYLGVAFYSLSFLFQLITLPVEFNASTRAVAALRAGGILTEEELDGVKKVLTAAALTYVAAMLVSLMNLLRLGLIVVGRGRRNN